MSLFSGVPLPVLIAGALALFAQTCAGREVLPLDPAWRFHQGPAPGAEAPGFDDAAWSTVDAPHDWSIAGVMRRDAPTRGDGAWLPSGVAYYRRTLELPPGSRGKRVFVEFDGLMANSDVWINGQPLGHRPNGYVGQRYELTDHLRLGPGEANVLAVRTDTTPQPASRWYTGGGIYRHARLVVTDPVHIAGDGVWVTTPEVTPEAATVRVTVEAVNQGAGRREVNIRCVAHDPRGNPVGEGTGTLELAPGATEAAQVTLRVESPRLWDVRDPHLHRLVTTLTDAGRETDRVETQFGVRTAEFRADSGFWLNGRNLKLQGVCLHHDGGAVGAAVPLAVWERRLDRLQALGVNAIRTAHNPPAPEFLDLCDRRGLLVMEEFFDCWEVGKRRADYHNHFRAWWRRDLTDTVRRDRNHPSVVLWSVGNEIHDTPREDHAKRILRQLVDACHAADPTRPVTQALFRPNVSHDYDNGLADMLDVIGTNYRDRELLDAWRDNPQRKIIGTEQGHDRSTWIDCRDNPQHAGQFLWCGVDYLGEARAWPVMAFNGGLLDKAGFVTPLGLQRTAWWGGAPVVHAVRRLAPDDKTPTDPGYETLEWKRRQVTFPDWTPHLDAPHDEAVEVYSNCDEVELLLNGRSLGAKPRPADASPFAWRVAYEPGELVAIGRNSGAEAARDALRTAGAAHAVALTVDRPTVGRAWDDVATVEATLVDQRGTRLPRADHTVRFSVTGPGRVIAVDSGSIVSHEPFQATERRAYQGRCIALVRATGEGAITVRAEADGVAAGEVTLNGPGAGD